MTEPEQIIGLIPAAGRASRLGNLPFSKELLPLNSSSPIPRTSAQRFNTAIDNTLETMTMAGIADICIIIAPGKWDIPAHTGDGKHYGQCIAYILAESSPSVPASLDAAWFLTREREVALLFPDIVFEPKHALQEIIDHRRQLNADLALALVPAISGEKIDIVTVSETGRVERVTPKPGKDHKGWTWIAATWNTRFGQFLHDELLSIDGASVGTTDQELYVADLFNAALCAGYQVTSRAFPEGISYDLGTYDELDIFWQSGH